MTKNSGREELTVVSLRSHVSNVESLVKAWSSGFTPSPNHHDKLIEAAHYHDEAKKFAWTVLPNSSTKRGRVVPPERHAWRGADLYRSKKGEKCDVYVYWLIRLHHSFKAEYIVEAMADIKAHTDADYRHFARDLYLLITCDWFDSGMLNYLATADQETDPREPHPFEEFVLRKEQKSEIFWLEPNPLKETTTLSLEYVRLPKTLFSDTDEFRKALKNAVWQTKHYEIRTDRDELP